MAKPKGVCLDSLQLQRFLDEQLTEKEERGVEDHIGECEQCQASLESLVTRGSGWDLFRSRLKDFTPDSNIVPNQPQTGPHAVASSPKNRSDIDTEIGEDTTPEQDLFDFKSWLAPSEDPSMLGRLGRYEIVGVVGRGSMGVVFKALDRQLNRYVAIKMLAPGYSHLGMSRKRFEREGRAIASVRDPHVIEVYGVEEVHGRPLIVMQYFPDGSLERRLSDEGWFSTKETCCIGMQIAKGLAAAHKQGVIHRDIKPANILLENGIERAVVTDFGLARVADEATMTRTGTIAGTPQFMSPEQAKGESLDFQTDLFSLGSVMYAMCTGQSPFRGETLMGVMHHVCETAPRPIREINPDIAEWMAAFIHRLLEKNKADRFESAQQIANLLTEELAYLQTPTSAPRPERNWMPSESNVTRRIAIIGVVMAVAIAAFVSWIWFGEPNREATFGIKPTLAETSFSQAKAAYDLAYETHIAEASLRGDMANSIEEHKKAFELGYNKALSAYNLACAYAFEDSHDLAFQWLERAIELGFRDIANLASDKDLDPIRDDKRFNEISNRMETLMKEYALADQVYFNARDYETAEKLYRKCLEDCPEDEFGIMMVGASLLEQGKYEESRSWHERTRNSVRLANFGSYNLGCIAANQNDPELAFSYLNYAAQTGFTDVNHLESDPQLAPLKKDVRFQQLADRMREQSGQ